MKICLSVVATMFAVVAFGQCDTSLSENLNVADWSVALDGGTPCLGTNTDQLAFELSTNVNGCWGVEWGSGIEVVLDVAPESHDFTVNSISGLLCFQAGQLSLSYDVTVVGSYSGTFSIQPDGGCVEVTVPFSFEVGGAPSPIEVPFAEWSNLFNGGLSSCSIQNGYQFVQYDAPTGTQDFYGVEFNNGIELVIEEAPEGHDFVVHEAYGSLCGWGALDVYYSVSIPGQYSGYFVIDTGVSCNALAVPFEFTIDDAGQSQVEIEGPAWNGLLNGQSTCANSGYDYVYLDSPLDICDSGQLGTGLALEISSQPDGGDFFLDYGYWEICGDGYLEVSFGANVEGMYTGFFILESPSSCTSVAIPFEFVHSNTSAAPLLVTETYWAYAFDGGVICPTSTGSDWLEYNPPTGIQDFYGVELGNGLEVEILNAPENGDLNFQYAYGSLCGWGYIETNYDVSVEGTYEGQFLVETGASCETLAVPFSFSVEAQDSVTPVLVQDIQWGGLFDGATTCGGNGYANGYFDDPIGFSNCWGANLNEGLSLVLTEAPENNDFSINWAYAELCGSGYIDAEYSVSTPGSYQGYFEMSLDNTCQISVQVPFNFTISQDDLPPAVAQDMQWYNGPFDGATTCGASGYTYGYFSDPSGSGICWGTYLNEGLNVVLTEAPENNDFSINWAYAELCGSGYIDAEYSVSASGFYQGYFEMFPSDACQSVQIPFNFTISQDDLPPAVAQDMQWYNGPFDGATTCGASGYTYGYFSDPSGSGICWGTYLNEGLNVVLTEAPENNDFSINWAYAELCGSGYIDAEYSVSTSGFYEGYFEMFPSDACQSVQIPFNFTISQDDLPPAVAQDMQWYNGPFDGATTCGASGYTSGYFSDPSGSGICWGTYLFEGLNVVLTEAPEDNDFSINWAYAELCGSGYIDAEYSVSTPGSYQGYFEMFPSDACQSVQVPFNFTISQDELPPAVAQDVQWDNGPFDGSITCGASGYTSGYFSDPSGSGICWGENLGYGVNVVLTEAPEGSDFSINWAYAELCGSGYIDAEYSVSTPGSYQGYFEMFPNNACQSVQVPFNFTIAQDDIPPAVVQDAQWYGGPFNGATTCETSGYTYGYFSDPSGSGICWGTYLNDGLNIVLTEAPEYNDFSINWAYAELCGSGYIDAEYSVSTPGSYQGYFEMFPSDACQSVQIPFAFTISQDDLPPAVAQDVQWYNGPFEGTITCGAGGYTYGYFSDPSGSDICWGGNLGYDVNVVLTEAPEDNDFSINWAYAELCGSGYIDAEYSVSTPGSYQGYFEMFPSDACQSVQVPFNFTISQDELPPAVAQDVQWDNGLFDGSITCGASGYTSGYFSDPSGAGICWGTYLFEGLNVVLTEAPENNDFSINWAYAELCGSGYIEAEYSVSTPGLYQGYFELSPSDACQSISVPFELSIDASDPIIIDIPAWNGPMGSGETCETSGSDFVYFESPFAEIECSAVEMNDGIQLHVVNQPVDGDLAVTWANAFICEETYLALSFTASVAGTYEGYISLTGINSCESIMVPFSVTKNGLDAVGVCGGDCELDDDGDGICDVLLPDLCGEGTFYHSDLELCLPSDCVGDFDFSSTRGALDLLFFLTRFGEECNSSMMLCQNDNNGNGICDDYEHDMCGEGTAWNPEIGQCVTNMTCPADFNLSGDVTASDLIRLLTVFNVDCNQ